MGKKLKLNDKAIEEHISDWSYVTKDKDGNKIIKQKGVRSYTPFDVEKTGRLKGMKLVEFRDKDGKSTSKYFCVQFKINGKSKYYSFGQFLHNIYGSKEASDELNELHKKHTNEKGRWITDPNIEKKISETRSTLDQVEEDLSCERK